MALGFAFQEIASNFIAGIFISIREPYKIGDFVEVDGVLGEVTTIELRTTHLTTYQGLEVLIPNKDMFTKTIINYTSTPKRRIDVAVGISYAEDLKKVEEVCKEALKSIHGRIPQQDINIFFHEFGDSSINFSAQVWVRYASGADFFKAQHQAIMAIKSAFDKHDITIPFPIRTLDFGIKGGMNLQEIQRS